MKIDLSGKNAIVCGASQGIGWAIAKQFASCGANLLLIARSESKLLNNINELHKNENQRFDYLTADLSEPNKLNELLLPKLKEFGTFHILVNNSGGPKSGKISEASVEDIQLAINSHLIAYQLLTQIVLPGMKKENYGRIINITSIGAKQPIDNLGVSNTIRGAISSWAKILSREVAPFGITVNNLLPGYILTERLKSLFQSEAERNGTTFEIEINKLTENIPEKRIGSADEIGFAVAFLASNFANYITGINLPVDGGFLRTL